MGFGVELPVRARFRVNSLREEDRTGRAEHRLNAAERVRREWADREEIFVGKVVQPKGARAIDERGAAWDLDGADCGAVAGVLWRDEHGARRGRSRTAPEREEDRRLEPKRGVAHGQPFARVKAPNHGVRGEIDLNDRVGACTRHERHVGFIVDENVGRLGHESMSPAIDGAAEVAWRECDRAEGVTGARVESEDRVRASTGDEDFVVAGGIRERDGIPAGGYGEGGGLVERRSRSRNRESLDEILVRVDGPDRGGMRAGRGHANERPRGKTAEFNLCAANLIENAIAGLLSQA